VLCHWGVRITAAESQDDLRMMRMTNLFHSSTNDLFTRYSFHLGSPHPLLSLPSPLPAVLFLPSTLPKKCRCGLNSRWRRSADFVPAFATSRNISIATNGHILKSVLIAVRRAKSTLLEGNNHPYQIRIGRGIDMCFVQ
jgi:hypothetical protein